MIRRIAIVSVLCLVPAMGWSQEAAKPTIKREAAKNTSSTDGKQMFEAYCSPCHGKDGKGNGPAALALKSKPADLTMITKNHNGVFSQRDFEERIAGTSMAMSHGTEEMPIWGPIFRDLPGNDKLRVFNLKKYIDTLQVK
jgi:mono/diheme cytochrome c family protein